MNEPSIDKEFMQIVNDLRSIIEQGRKQAYAEVAKAAITTYWNIGRRLVEEEQHGEERAAYGTHLIKGVAEKLVPIYGNCYNKRNLDYYKRFYLLFPDLQIVNTRVHNLNWSHIRRLLSVSDSQARLWYLETADRDMWSVRTLDRNISTQYYNRRLAVQKDTTANLTEMIDQTNPMGWIIAMQQMCVGDKWEVYIPAEMGYGKFSQPDIPGGSTLIFEIELMGIPA